MNREELVQAVHAAFNFEGGMGYDCHFDVTDIRGALRALSAYAGFARTSPPSKRSDVIIVDSVEHGEILAGCSRASCIELVRRDCDGHVDGDHLREILRRVRDAHGRVESDLLGCFTVTPDGKQDLDDLAALFVDGCAGHTFFDYSHAPQIAIDMNPMNSYHYDAQVARSPWKSVCGEEMGYGRKIGHAWKYAVFADLRGRVPGADAHALVASYALRKDYKRGPVWA